MKDNYDVKLLQWVNRIIKYTLLMSKDLFTIVCQWGNLQNFNKKNHIFSQLHFYFRKLSSISRSIWATEHRFGTVLTIIMYNNLSKAHPIIIDVSYASYIAIYIMWDCFTLYVHSGVIETTILGWFSTTVLMH